MLRSNTRLKAFRLNSTTGIAREGVQIIFEAIKANKTLTELNLGFCELPKEDVVAAAEMLRMNSVLKKLDLIQYAPFDSACQVLAQSLVGHKSVGIMSWPDMSLSSKQRCSAILMEGNGSLVHCGGAFVKVCDRNREMHENAREAVQTVRVLRMRK